MNQTTFTMHGLASKILARQIVPTHKPHFVPGDLQFLTSNTYRRAKLLESDRLLAIGLR